MPDPGKKLFLDWLQSRPADTYQSSIMASEGKRLVAMIDSAITKYERVHDALEKIAQWSEAYPLDIFPEPDLERARELLKAGGITLDAVSAHCMRHVINGVGKIARDALKEVEP